MRVLAIEPYHGGSHKAFLENLGGLPLELELMALPARKWKWRMRLAAPYFAEKLKKDKRRFDRILCSTFLDVAAFRGLAPKWLSEVPLLTYFHENQFAYPVQVDDERDMHFALTNMTTALASDSIAFNSSYNLTTFLDGINGLMQHSGDMKKGSPAAAIAAKATVIPPGVDFTHIDNAKAERRAKVPVVLWNHRWEHDKDPERFFEALLGLDKDGLGFKLVVLGESFERKPPIFREAKKRLSKRILHFGYEKSRSGYAKWLKASDIVVSTARHEFFGIAVLEAVRAGCRPLLPNGLSYPEIFPAEFLYEDGAFEESLRREILFGKRRLSPHEAHRLTRSYSWDTVSRLLMSWIENATVKTG